MKPLTLTWAFLAVLAVAAPSHAAIALSNGATDYDQDFNSLATSGTSSTVPSGWAFVEVGTNANGTYGISSGSANSGDRYSFGSDGSSERALGTQRTGTVIPTIGAQFKNTGTTPITSLAVSYQGEEWRLGVSGRNDRLDFEYSLDAADLSSGVWTDLDGLDFSTPITTGTGAKNGNAAGLFASLNATITGVSISPDSTFWIRWLDVNATDPDDGLGVDDFHITATFVTAVPEANAFLFAATICSVTGLVSVRRYAQRKSGR